MSKRIICNLCGEWFYNPRRVNNRFTDQNGRYCIDTGFECPNCHKGREKDFQIVTIDDGITNILALDSFTP